MIYKENYQVEYSDCDENRHLKLARLVDLFMQTSEHQLQKGGGGTEDLLKKGLGWVVTQYHCEIESLPAPGDKITLATKASGYNRFFEYRDFFIEDSLGHTIVTVKSQWVMFDLQKRKMTTADEQLMQAFQVPLLKRMPRFPRIRPQEKYEQKRQYRVRYDDLDTNHHLTNSHYLNWFVDSLDRDFLRQNIPQTIDLKFDKEVRYGQEPFSCLHLDQENLKSYHLIQALDGQEQSVCEISWRSL